MMSVKSAARAAALVAAVLAMAAPVAAHHSASMYEFGKQVEVKGTLKQFNWVNPHCTIVFIAEGTGETWLVEGTSPGVLTRLGWTKRSLNPGDHINMMIAPLRSGGPAGYLIQVKNLQTGMSLKG